MFTQCKRILIYIVIVLLLYLDTICTTRTKNVTRFAGVVENVTVHVLEGGSYLENNNMLKSLKLNISWLPPSEGKQPSSYSVMITSTPKENDVNKIECTEGSALYTVQNVSSLNVLVPQSKLFNDMPEVQIRPNCMYKIQVYANPRDKSAGKPPEVIYIVPECIGRKCSCANAKDTLPVPKVEAIRVKGNVVINWNITSNDSRIRSYIISIGVPLLTSKTGLSVYNITRISNVNSTTRNFSWDSKINDQYLKLKSGYKILVATADYRDCSGAQGNFTIIDEDETKTFDENIIWLLLTGFAICIILGFVGVVSVRNKNGYQLVWPSKWRKTMPEPPACRLAHWPDLVIQQRNNGVYIEQRPEEMHCEMPNDEYEVPYRCINLVYELGKGQFGRVYLGNLNNNEDRLIAVKMSQCSHHTSCEPEIRHQLLDEIKIMKAVGSHPHLVSLIGCCTSPNNPICILLEYMEGGDLLAYLHSRRKIESDDMSLCSFEKAVSRYANIIKRDRNEGEGLHGVIEKQQFMKFALDISRGMEHLEAKGITHRDLAARNILLTSDLTLKVSDFGLSRNGIYVINNVAGKTRQLPIRWMSPEAVRDHAFSTKSDVWSFAIVLWEIGTLGSFPYGSIHDDELLSYLTQGKCRLDCPDTISHDMYKIMCSCWSSLPRDRPSFAQLVLDLQTLKEPIHSATETSNPCYILLSK